jgi:hypothetical protein
MAVFELPKFLKNRNPTISGDERNPAFPASYFRRPVFAPAGGSYAPAALPPSIEKNYR